MHVKKFKIYFIFLIVTQNTIKKLKTRDGCLIKFNTYYLLI